MDVFPCIPKEAVACWTFFYHKARNRNSHIATNLRVLNSYYYLRAHRVLVANLNSPSIAKCLLLVRNELFLRVLTCEEVVRDHHGLRLLFNYLESTA